jgi:hypothetical protein
MTEFKIAVMEGVREHTERGPVELWLNEEGRVVIRSYNECGNNYTDVDLPDLVDWLRSGPRTGFIDGAGITALPAFERN